jgi:hypothetical protein
MLCLEQGTEDQLVQFAESIPNGMSVVAKVSTCQKGPPLTHTHTQIRSKEVRVNYKSVFLLIGEASNFEIHNLAKHTLVRSNGAGCEEAVFWLARLDAPLKKIQY